MITGMHPLFLSSIIASQTNLCIQNVLMLNFQQVTSQHVIQLSKLSLCQELPVLLVIFKMSD